jgi:hypothetical protein
VAQHHIDNLTGIQPATIQRYPTHVTRDIHPAFESIPISALTQTIAGWIKQIDSAFT